MLYLKFGWNMRVWLRFMWVIISLSPLPYHPSERGWEMNAVFVFLALTLADIDYTMLMNAAEEMNFVNSPSLSLLLIKTPVSPN